MSSAISTGRAANVLGVVSTVTVLGSAGEKIPLFGPTEASGGIIPKGVHTVTIAFGAAPDTITAQGSLVIADVNEGGTAADWKSRVVDFAGLPYCSLNAFTSTSGVKFLLAGHATTSNVQLYREGLMTTDPKFSFSSTSPGTYVISINSQTSENINLGVSSAHFYRSLELAPATGTFPSSWSSSAPARPLTMLTRGTDDITSSLSGDVILTSGGLSLAPGHYLLNWRMAGFGVDKFQSYVKVDSGTIIPSGSPDAAVLIAGKPALLGTPAFSAATSSSALCYSMGSVVIRVTVTALLQLEGVCATTNPVQGRGNLNNDHNPAITAGPAIAKDILSEVRIQVLSA